MIFTIEKAKVVPKQKLLLSEQTSSPVVGISYNTTIVLFVCNRRALASALWEFHPDDYEKSSNYASAE